MPTKVGIHGCPAARTSSGGIVRFPYNDDVRPVPPLRRPSYPRQGPKHALSLAVSGDIDPVTALYARNERYDDRFQALGFIDGSLHMLVFTMRGGAMRAISLRKANTREVKRYGDKSQTTG